jgi:hypothetical protein
VAGGKDEGDGKDVQSDGIKGKSRGDAMKRPAAASDVVKNTTSNDNLDVVALVRPSCCAR